MTAVPGSQGGREGRDIGAVELAKAVEALGTGEILLNCIDCDGAKQVGDRAMMQLVPLPGIVALFSFATARLHRITMDTCKGCDLIGFDTLEVSKATHPD